MNILLLTYQGDLAGSTLSITYLAKGLALRGHHVYVGCRKDSLLFTYFQNSEVQVIPMTFRSKTDWKNVKHIREVCRQFHIDIINAQSSLDRYTSIIAKKILGVPAKLVFTRRQVSKSIGGPQSWLYQWGADKIVAVSERIRESLVHDGISPKHIAVIRNGTPPEKYENIDLKKTEELRSTCGISAADFVVGCVSRLKKQRQVLEALQYLDRPVTVVFVGIDGVPGFDLSALESSGHRVYFAGTMPASEVLPYYGLFDVKILASTSEGMSQSLLEAMYLKVPVIATAAAGNLDLIEEGKNGLMFQDGDVKTLASLITQIREDDQLRELLSQEGYQTASVGFSIENTLDGYEMLFRELQN
jgi:glycosyltransferase involved in cell wall biosynthesis